MSEIFSSLKAAEDHETNNDVNSDHIDLKETLREVQSLGQGAPSHKALCVFIFE